MSSWRDKILAEFTPEISKLTLVADPDGLLLEEGVLEGIRERGFDLIPFEDSIAFRFAYESKYRSYWDRGEKTELVVVLRSEADDLRNLPYDLLKSGRQLSFNLGELFPNLSYPVVEALDRADLDALDAAQQQFKPGNLGDNATKDFALRHVFEIAPEMVKQAHDLLRVLLRHHYRAQRVPRILADRMVKVLEHSGGFEGWPLADLVSHRAFFFQFLQERWGTFVRQMVPKTPEQVNETDSDYGYACPGPSELPFDHDDVRVYMDNLFLDGLLKPVEHPDGKKVAESWMRFGLRVEKAADHQERLEKLLDAIVNDIPDEQAKHRDWMPFAQRWGELRSLQFQPGQKIEAGLNQKIAEAEQSVDPAFFTWLLHRYQGLHNQPPYPPVMLHHLPRALARSLEEGSADRVALVVLDGMSYSQWISIRRSLEERQTELAFTEEAVFAWAPTLTCVSRQALFAGKIPLYFPSTIDTTNNDESVWKQFWSDHGLTASEVFYRRGLGDSSDLKALFDDLSHKERAVGLVVDKVDKIMHGMELGMAGMHNQVRQWAGEGFLGSLLIELIQGGFDVTLTSDHGNIEAEGCGKSREGATAEFRGARARTFRDAASRSKVSAKYHDAAEWPPAGLPSDYLPLFAPARKAFVNPGEKIVAHGGVNLEELIVPFVKVTQRSKGKGQASGL